MNNQHIPISQQSLQFVRYLERVITGNTDQAARLANLLWMRRKLGERFEGPAYQGIFDLRVCDPREGLDHVGTALLSLLSSSHPGPAWQVKRKVLPDPVRPGAFSFQAIHPYVWYHQDPSFSLAYAVLDLECIAQLDESCERLRVTIDIRDEWAWLSSDGLEYAAKAWRTIVNGLSSAGLLEEVVRLPSAPAASSYRVPHLAAEPFVSQAQQLSRQGNHAAALAAYDMAVAIDPFDPFNYGNRANCKFFLGDLQGATEDSTTAIEIKPSDPNNYINRSEFLRRAGSLEQAWADANLAVRLNPADAGGFVARARALKAMNRIDEARSDYRKAFELEPEYPQLKEELASIGGLEIPI